MRKLWKTLLILVVLAGASAGVYAWSRSGKNDKGLKLVDVTSGSIVEKAVAVGQIQPRQKFQVKSKISGIVRRALVQVGDTVRAGDALFEIGPDPTPLEVTEVDRQVDSANASYSRAKTDYERATELARSGVMPKSDTDQKRDRRPGKSPDDSPVPWRKLSRSSTEDPSAGFISRPPEEDEAGAKCRARILAA